MYQYRATVERWVDGDTVDLIVDLGFNMTTKQRFRLLDIDTPERGQVNYDVARRCAESIHPAGSSLEITSIKSVDKYGRYLVKLPKVEAALRLHGLIKGRTL